MGSYEGEAIALATAFCWTISTLSFTDAARRSGSLSVNLIRLTVACILFSAYGLLTARGLAFPSDAPARAWIWLSISGFVGFFLGDLVLLKAFVLIGPRLSALLMLLASPMAAALGWIALGERLSALHWLGIGVTVSGVAWVVIERRSGAGGAGERNSPAGIACGILAAMGQAAGAILSKIGMGDYDAFASTQIRALTGLAGFLLLAAVLGWFPRLLEAARSPRVVLSTSLGAFMGPFIGVALFLRSMQLIQVGIAQTLVSIVPVLIIPFVIVLYRERVSARAVAGACLAIAGVALLFLKLN